MQLVVGPHRHFIEPGKAAELCAELGMHQGNTRRRVLDQGAMQFQPGLEFT